VESWQLIHAIRGLEDEFAGSNTNVFFAGDGRDEVIQTHLCQRRGTRSEGPF
jgi:hypothetical protein